ncbi:o-succinylbenzoate synthase [Microbacterium sp. 4R-513]|uniref:o-succinylbenzoate synthase n=1 Tax=Microbacterium sp. 4R-513 TaxID=2567934 RepID=UPI0013E1C4F7|nr:o-succinylbenzoate synthase [Microbacterium sp. 4R-513]QIG39497.1 o-succinylbenzoate synthase [Microbacterium sp. 4R-513]
MRVTDVDLFRVSLPLVHEFETSSHRKSAIEHILVRLTDESGEVGWGEIASPTDPFYSSETVATAEMIGRDHLVPLTLARPWTHPSELAERWRIVRGHEFAKAGFDIAAWDLWSRMQGVSLSSALGGTRRQVAAGVSLGIEPTIDGLLEQVQRHVDGGYPRVKLKIKPGWDVEPVRAVRDAFPGILLHVDANGGYPTGSYSITRFKRLDAFDLAMVEQPFAPREFVAHADLARSVSTPVCLDESVVDTGDLATMIALRAGTVLNIKVSRMGGLTPALKAYRMAQESGIAVWCGGMHEFGVGRAANVALSSLAGFHYPSDVSGSEKYYARDVIEPVVVARAGLVDVPRGPGLGHEVVMERIAPEMEVV